MSLLLLAGALAACGGGSDSGGSDSGGGDSGGGSGGATSLDGVSVIATGGIEGLGIGPEAWGFGILVENANTETKNVRLRAFALDASGTVIDTSKEVLLPVQASSRGAAVGQFLGVLPDQEVASVAVAIESVETSWFGTSIITVADITQVSDRVTGVVSTDAGRDLKNSSIVAVILDASGTIIGGGVDVPTVLGSGTTPFEVLLSGASSGGELIVLASPSGVDL